MVGTQQQRIDILELMVYHKHYLDQRCHHLVLASGGGFAVTGVAQRAGGRSGTSAVKQAVAVVGQSEF